jgi:hypothetical protein
MRLTIFSVSNTVHSLFVLNQLVITSVNINTAYETCTIIMPRLIFFSTLKSIPIKKPKYFH